MRLFQLSQDVGRRKKGIVNRQNLVDSSSSTTPMQLGLLAGKGRKRIPWVDSGELEGERS